jgi:outer membrane protein assembly factor BamA
LLLFYDLTNPDIFNDPTLAHIFLGYTNPYLLSYLVQQVIVDLRHRPLDTRSGFYGSLNLEEGVPLGGTFTYVKVSPDVRAYVPLGSRVVLAGRVIFGRLEPRTSSDSPITRRFYEGGADSHRGFNYNRLAPQVPSGDNGAPIPIGGDTMLLMQVEARIDLFKIKGSWLGMAAFFDAGDVPQREFGLALGQLHLAVGGGLRYHTVVGTVRFDVGVRLNRLSPTQPDGRQNPDPGQRFAFHLSIGEAF